MKVLIKAYQLILNTVGMIMCNNTRMHKQYVYVKKSTYKDRLKQRF